jgi:hypothetical protein
MEEIMLDQDIQVFAVAASSFPGGVMEAHTRLHSIVPFSTARKYYGLSRPENGQIIYKAAAEILEGDEAGKTSLESMVIKRGNYIGITIEDFMKDIQSIGKAFNDILSHPGIDPDGYCVEWYLKGKDVRCMVRLGQ